MSTCERMRQKWSMPSSMACVMKGCMGATTAPARSNSRAACSTAARTSGSTARPQPASSSRPMRRPLSLSTPCVELAPRDVLERQAHAVARVGQRQHLHEPGGVGHAARHRPGGPAHVGRVDRDAAQAGLEGEDAAPAGGQPQRAADVGADVQRAVARGRGRTGAGAGAARRAAPGPRGCAPACGSSTGPTRACRSRAWWSWRSSRRRLRARVPPAARRRRPATARSRRCPAASGRPAVAMFSLMVTGTPSSGPSGAPRSQRASLARACCSASSGPQQVERLQVVLPALDVAEHGLGDLHRREFAPAVSLDQRRRRQLMQCARASVMQATVEAQDSADRSFTKIGMSFHSPLTFLLATVDPLRLVQERVGTRPRPAGAGHRPAAWCARPRVGGALDTCRTGR